MAERVEERDPWYFACECGAKFFAEERSVECPRCRQQVTSPERIKPPWKKKLYTVTEVSNMLSVSESWLYSRVSQGEIRCHRLGGIKFSDEDIAEMLQGAKKDKRERREADTQIKATRRPPLKHIKF